MQNPNYYSIIPAEVRYDKNLVPNAKLLYAEITALLNINGHCFASNRYFANLYNKSTITISRWISQLKKLGYIDTHIQYKKGTKQIESRSITLSKKMIIPINKNDNRGINKNVKDNINNTKVLYNNINKNNKKGKKQFDIQLCTFPDIFQKNVKLKKVFFEFVEMRKELKKPLKTKKGVETKLRSLARDCEKYGTDIVIGAIYQSIENEYQGIFVKSYAKNNKQHEKSTNDKGSIYENYAKMLYADTMQNKGNSDHCAGEECQF